MTIPKVALTVATALALLVVGCRKQSSMTVKVHVKTGDGDDINGAVISVDHELIGETNAFGTLSYSFRAEQGSIHRIDVSKENDTYYFAPHFETVKVPKAAKSEWDVTATLYMVPKPRATKANLSEAIAEVKVTAPEQSATTTAPTSSRDQGIWSAYPFLEEGDATPSTVDLSVTEDEQGQAKNMEADETSLFTVHTYQGKEPMPHTEVYSCMQDRAPELLCTSNDRGRCVVRLDTALSSASWSLLIKNPHTRTQILSGPFEKNANVRANLVAGKSDDYLVVYDDFGLKNPVADASVVIVNEPSMLKTSMCGVLSVPVPKTAESKVHLRVSHKSIKNDSQEFDFDTQERKAFRTVEVMPAKHRMPSFVVEPVLPGANLTQEDFQQWFSVAQSKRSNTDIVRALKSSNLKAVRLDEFQDLSRVTNRGVAVVQKSIKAWDDNPKNLAAASHQVRVVLFRAGVNLSASIQVYDARGIAVFSAREIVPSSADLPRVITTALQPLTTKNSTPKWSELNVVGPVGRWLLVRSERSNTSEPDWHAIDAGATLILKPGRGYLDMQVTVAANAVMTAAFDPLIYQEDLVEKVYEESTALNVAQVLSLLSGIPKDHPQRRRLDLMAAYLESLGTDPAVGHIASIAHDQNEDFESIPQQMNRSIALVMLADRQSFAKEERLKNALEAIPLLDKIADSEPPASDVAAATSLKRLALFYRGQAKMIVGDLKGDPMVAMDAEADTREFLKRSDHAPTKSSREERLRIAASKSLKATDLQ